MSATSVSYGDDDTVDRVISARHGPLVLAKDDCDNCAAAYKSQLQRLREEGLSLAWSPVLVDEPPQITPPARQLAR